MYFLIVEQNIYSNFNWKFGTPFLKKYELTFDQDRKTISYYLKSNDNNYINSNNDNKFNFLWVIVFIFAFIVLILIYVFKKKIFLKLKYKKNKNIYIKINKK